MNKVQQQVQEFHEKFGVTVNNSPRQIEEGVIDLRINLIQEEWDELQQAMKSSDMVAIADGLADLAYVLYGTAVTYGINLEPISDEVHRSNMTKVWPDGSVQRREDGKILKPPTYSKADIASCLLRQERS